MNITEQVYRKEVVQSFGNVPRNGIAGLCGRFMIELEKDIKKHLAKFKEDGKKCFNGVPENTYIQLNKMTMIFKRI